MTTPTVQRYESAAQAAQWLANAGKQTNDHIVSGEGYGANNFAGCAKLWLDNPVDQDDVQRLKNLMGKIDASLENRLRDEYQPDVQGAYPIVPDYLAGSAYAMRSKQPTESIMAPVTIWVELGVSNALRPTQGYYNRAAAIGVLATTLAETRPVALKIIAASNVHGGSPARDVFIQIDVAPQVYDPSLLAATLISYRYSAAVRWGLICRDCPYYSGIGWAFGSNISIRGPKIRKVFGITEQDVFIPAAIMGTSTENNFHNPVQWVHDQIERQRRLDGND